MNETYFDQLQTEVSLRNLTASTGKTYQGYLKSFLEQTGINADEITMDNVRSFLITKKTSGTSSASLNLYNLAIRFFVRRVLHKQWDWELVPRMKVDRKLPVILTQEEIQRIIDITKNLKHKAMIATMYSSGLRVSELCQLHYCDISRSNMHIHVRHTKSRMDRYAVLSERNLEILTAYWYQCGKPRNILFPSSQTGNYIDKNSIAQMIKRIALQAGIYKKVSCHTFRHSFACHMLESGVDKTYIQILLGHLDPRSTQVYLHMTNKAFMGIKSPFDNFGGAHE